MPDPVICRTTIPSPNACTRRGQRAWTATGEERAMGFAASLITLGCLGSLLLGGCSRTARHTYHVTESQLEQMRAIAGITSCQHGPTIFAGMKRAEGGGLVHIECPRPSRR